MSYTVKIRRNSDGEVRECRMEGEYEVPEPFSASSIWEDGNYSCDCNRERFFERAFGQEQENYKCSDGRFSVQLPDRNDWV